MSSLLRPQCGRHLAASAESFVKTKRFLHVLWESLVELIVKYVVDRGLR